MPRDMSLAVCAASTSLLLALLLGFTSCPHMAKAQQNPPPRPDLITTGADPSGFWHRVQDGLFRELSTDQQISCKSAASCPCTTPDGCTFTNGRCGVKARAWWRMVFHDAGTFNRNDRTGGMDGSLQYELDRPENPFQLSIDFYRQLLANVSAVASPPASTMADTIALGGFVALWVCGGPVVPFTPGRRDATGANLPNMLPGPNDAPDVIARTLNRINLNPKEAVLLIGAGHTIAAMNGQFLDSTPERFDNLWFQQLLTRSAPSTLPSDAGLLQRPETATYIRQYADQRQFDTDFRASLVQAAIKLSWLGQPGH